MKTRALLVLLFSSSLAAPLAGQAVTTDSLTGQWDGEIIVVPAENEMDVSVEFTRDSQGNLHGELWFPTQRPKRYEIHELLLKDLAISFMVKDESGITSIFTGEFSRDGREVRGRLAEAPHNLPFTLHRRVSPELVSDRPVLRISADGTELRQAFDRQAGQPRLLMILSPSLLSSRMSLRLLQRYVLDKITDPRLQVYVVWEPVYRNDTESKARQAAALADDLRILHFWSGTRFAGQTFKSLSNGGAKPVSDLLLLFAGGQRWESTAPVPQGIRYLQQTGVAAPSLGMNALQLKADVLRLLSPDGKQRAGNGDAYRP